MPLKVAVISPSSGLAETVKPFLKDGDSLTSSSEYRFDEIRNLQPDLVVLDITSPPLAALDLLNRLERQAATRKIAVIAVSDLPELEYEAVKVLDFLVRPVDPVRFRHNLDLLRKGERSLERKPSPGHLGDNDHRLFHDYFVMTTGLHFEKSNARLLERGLAHRMTALRIATYPEYYDYLVKYQESRNELKKLLQFLTVGETFFFRYRGHFEALTQVVVPRLRAREVGRKNLRIWSAGCSTGEEPYSIAIALLEGVPDLADWQVTIQATDINQRALTAAREGMFGDRTLRITPEAHIQRYFRHNGRQYEISNQVKEMVEFRWLNLQAPFPWEAEGPVFDIIFCRNVMIYFSAATFRKVVARLSAALKPGGYLFLGHSETLYQVSDDFETVRLGGCFFYRKLASKDERVSRVPREETRRPARPQVKRPEPEPELEPEVAEVEETVPAPLFPEDARFPDDPAFDIEKILKKADLLFEENDFAGAAVLAAKVLQDDPGNAQALILEGFILANQGRLDDALERCERALAADDLMAEAYYLKGLIHDLSDEWREATALYRKAILLQPHLVMAHYFLARLLVRHGKRVEGERSLKAAIRQLEKSTELSQVRYSGGLVREELLELMKKEASHNGSRVGKR